MKRMVNKLLILVRKILKNAKFDLKSFGVSFYHWIKFKFKNFDFQNIIDTVLYHTKVWYVMSKNSFQIVLTKKILFLFFLFGKLSRFVFFIVFLFFLLKGSQSLAGYNINQTVFFFLTFNLIDILAQFLFREVYRFRGILISGDLDLVLAKPVNTLFRVLLGGADLIDLVTLPLLVVALIYVGSILHPTVNQTIFYVLLILNGLLIATAFHIAALSFGVITLEIDHTVMIYRDILNLGRLPVDIYKEPVRSLITFLIPVGIMITLPAKFLMGLASYKIVFVAFTIGFLSLFVSLRFWKVALRSYTSASS